MTKAEIERQIAENSKRIDKGLVRLHEARLHLEEANKKANEILKKYELKEQNK